MSKVTTTVIMKGQTLLIPTSRLSPTCTSTVGRPLKKKGKKKEKGQKKKKKNVRGKSCRLKKCGLEKNMD